MMLVEQGAVAWTILSRVICREFEHPEVIVTFNSQDTDVHEAARDGGDHGSSLTHHTSGLGYSFSSPISRR
jgi:hypothetical protein